MWKYYCYPLYGKHGSNSTLANIVEHSNDVGYWCKIDINFYNAHKDKLPECVSKAPSEWSDLTEEQAYEFFYNKIAAYTWVDNDVPKTINGFQFIENKIFESENEIKWVIKFINGGNTETNNGVLLTKDKKNWYKITNNKWKVNAPESTLEFKENTVELIYDGNTFIFTKQ